MNSSTVSAGLVALLVWAMGWGAAQAATITFVGSDISTANSGAWSAYRGDFRSTGSSAKAWTLANHPNAYGADGYILFGSTNYTQEADATAYQGSLYTGTRSGQDFNNPSPFISQVSILGTWSGGNTAVLDRWTIFDDGPSMDDPTLGIGSTVADIGTGSLWWRYDSITTKDLFKLTMGAVSERTVRVGIQTNRGDNQKTASIALGGISQPSGGTNGYYWPDWYFFDITGWTSGEVLYLTVTSRAGANGASAIGAIVFDSPEPASGVLLGLAGLALLGRRGSGRTPC